MNVILISDTTDLFKYANNNTYPILYNSNTTRNEVLNVLRQFQIKNKNKINRLALAFHYSDEYFLNGTHFFDELNIKFINDLIVEFQPTKLDYLACNTLILPEWISYYSKLNMLAGASDHYVGNDGGDWLINGEDVSTIYFDNIKEWIGILSLTKFGIVSRNDIIIDSSNNSVSSITIVNNSAYSAKYAIKHIDATHGYIVSRFYIYDTTGSYSQQLNIPNVETTQLKLIFRSITYGVDVSDVIIEFAYSIQTGTTSSTKNTAISEGLKSITNYDAAAADAALATAAEATAIYNSVDAIVSINAQTTFELVAYAGTSTSKVYKSSIVFNAVRIA